jgi:di/tricarboxylate transporter
VSDIAIVFSILGAVVVLFVWNRLPVELVAIGAALTLVATDVLELDQAIAGFGDSTVLFIASLFVVSEGLDATGVTTWAGQQLIAFAGDSQVRLMVAMMALVAVLTALISVNGAVAALMPMVVVVAIRLGRSPSTLLMPLAFGAHAGSMLALTGTPVNVIVSDALADTGDDRFGFFEFALVGIPLVIGTIAISVLLGPKVLPKRTPSSLPPDLSAHARTLSLQYLDDHRVFRLDVSAGSRIIGQTGADLQAEAPEGVDVVGAQAGGAGAPVRDRAIEAGDVLIVRGDADLVASLIAADVHVTFRADPIVLDDRGVLLDRDRGVAELMIPPRSGMIGARVFPGMVTDSGDLVILAVQRRGEDLGPTQQTLASGDALLVQGQWRMLDHHIGTDPDVLAVDAPAAVRRQAVPMGPKSIEAIGVLAGMVVLLATGVVPAVVAGLLAASAMVLLRVLTVEQAYRGISWTTVVLVGAMIPLSTAMVETGAAEEIAKVLVDAVGDLGPRWLLLGLFVLTAVLGQLISNMATALIVIPVALSAAAELDVSPRPVLMSLTVAAAASLLTPVATPANLMVMGPAGYRFGDYWKLGLPLLALFLVVSVGWVPVVWSF